MVFIGLCLQLCYKDIWLILLANTGRDKKMTWGAEQKMKKNKAFTACFNWNRYILWRQEEALTTGDCLQWNFMPSCLSSVCLYIFVCSYVCVRVKQQLWHLHCSAPARSWRANAQTWRLPQGPAGSPITPTQTPAVKHILLTRSFLLSLLSVLLLCFHFESLDSLCTFAAITFFTCPLFSLHLFCACLCFASRCFPGIVPTWGFTVLTLAVHGFHKVWRKEYRQAGRNTD